MNDFFSFRKMVTPIVIKILYALGAIALPITIFALSYQNSYRYNSPIFFLVLLGVIVAELVWRLLCETMILFFSMHEVLVQIKDNKRL